MSSATEIEFVGFNTPALSAGDYTINVDFSVTGPDGAVDKPKSTPTVSFSIAGPRFQLASDDIVAAFPPPDNLGINNTVLPLLVLGRKTLPWERSPIELEPVSQPPQIPIKEKDETSSNSASDIHPEPWLALLLFDEQDAPVVNSGTVADLLTEQQGTLLPALTDVVSEQVAVKYIEISSDDYQTMMPSWEDLPYLAHVRSISGEVSSSLSDETDGEYSVLMCPRLPASSGTSVVYLVSVEGFYQNNEGSTSLIVPDASQTQVRLVCLYHWRFASLDLGFSFKGLMQALNKTPSLLQPSPPNGVSDSVLLDFYQQGKQPFNQTLASAQHTLSWYRGPFTPMQVSWQTDPFNLANNQPTSLAHQLYVLDSDTGMLDVSYAAAWQLGQLQMINNKGLAVALYQWKQQNLYQITRNKLAGASENTDLPPAPAALSEWLGALALFEGIPYQYLVQQQDMLPSESIRFFQIDSYWQMALLKGALSVGAVPNQQAALQNFITQVLKEVTGDDLPGCSGVLLRSEAVQQWPDMIITAEGENSPSLSCIRRSRLAPDTLLLLFDGTIKNLSCHPHVRALHTGLQPQSAAETDWTLSLKPLSSGKGKANPSEITGIQLNNRVLQVSALLARMKDNLAINSTPTVAEFARQLIQPTPIVQFDIGGSPLTAGKAS